MRIRDVYTYFAIVKVTGGDPGVVVGKQRTISQTYISTSIDFQAMPRHQNQEESIIEESYN